MNSLMHEVIYTGQLSVWINAHPDMTLIDSETGQVIYNQSHNIEPSLWWYSVDVIIDNNGYMTFDTERIN